MDKMLNVLMCAVGTRLIELGIIIEEVIVKKLLFVIVIMLMALSLSACGLSNKPQNDMDNESISASVSASGDSALDFIPLVTAVEVSLIDITGKDVIIVTR